MLLAEAYAPPCAEPALTSHSRLVHYHRRGYAGSSRVAAPFSIAQQAADCLAVLRHLGIERAHVVGHSSGGAIGWVRPDGGRCRQLLRRRRTVAAGVVLHSRGRPADQPGRARRLRFRECFDLARLGRGAGAGAEWLPQTEVFVLAGANHALQDKDPRGVGDAMVPFLARQPMPALL
ncbi:MAG: alpha/beta fold hydrolase [Chloroflexi bacterium]|nr:alpha/beta fold hydrolase [Chloroflexota bacterium]